MFVGEAYTTPHGGPRGGFNASKVFRAMTREEWATCQDGALMLKLLGQVSGPPGDEGRRPFVLAACECARLSLRRVREDETRPLVAIETAERWARGEGVALDEVMNAAKAASVAAKWTDPHYTLFAAPFGAGGLITSHLYAKEANTSAEVAGAAAATAAACDAFIVGESIESAAIAAGAADCARKGESVSDRVGQAILRECADIVRKHFPEPPKGGGL